MDVHGAAQEYSPLSSRGVREVGAAAGAARRRRRRPGENRERLVNAGIAEFACHGYQGASTADIAHRAEVSQPHVYTNFNTKQELFLACLGRVVSAFGDAGPTAEVPSLAELVELPLGDEQHESSLAASYAQLVFQAVACAQDDTLQPDLERALDELRVALGEKRFEELILLGARSLLTSS